MGSYRNFNEILKEHKTNIQETYVMEVSTITESYLQDAKTDDHSLKLYTQQMVDTLLDERIVSFNLFLKSPRPNHNSYSDYNGICYLVCY